jgi:hypothetical protein
LVMQRVTLHQSGWLVKPTHFKGKSIDHLAVVLMYSKMQMAGSTRGLQGCMQCTRTAVNTTNNATKTMLGCMSKHCRPAAKSLRRQQLRDTGDVPTTKAHDVHDQLPAGCNANPFSHVQHRQSPTRACSASTHAPRPRLRQCLPHSQQTPHCTAP